ncbi:MAG: GIY-YIG nuclease family protein [Ignavibacteria bacterium]|nr:GIY-YIG nuclease family protein [Ignavibacteria bacterium]
MYSKRHIKIYIGQTSDINKRIAEHNLEYCMCRKVF